MNVRMIFQEKKVCLCEIMLIHRHNWWFIDFSRHDPMIQHHLKVKQALIEADRLLVSRLCGKSPPVVTLPRPVGLRKNLR